MIHDPTVEIECDFCHDCIQVQPEYKYRDYSGENGDYDCSDSAMEAAAISKGWIVIEDGNHKCDGCIDSEDN